MFSGDTGDADNGERQQALAEGVAGLWIVWIGAVSLRLCPLNAIGLGKIWQPRGQTKAGG